jgi:cytochrome c oxidase cbb3-type subunit 3
MRRARLVWGTVLLAGAAGIAACDRAPSPSGLSEWTPSDHDQEPGRPPPNQGARGDGGAATMVEVAWRNQCVTCHGANGHGDGPQGAMFKAADLSKPEWQDKVKDEEIAAAITNGKGRMPKFELPEDVVKGLVVRIRSFRGR